MDQGPEDRQLLTLQTHIKCDLSPTVISPPAWDFGVPSHIILAHLAEHLTRPSSCLILHFPCLPVHRQGPGLTHHTPTIVVCPEPPVNMQRLG